MKPGRLVFGVHPVKEALRSGRAHVVYLLEGESGAGLREVRVDAESRGVACEARARRELDALTEGKVNQGVVALCGEFPYAEVDDILAAAERRAEPPLVLVLDGVQDPGNLGALVRTAHVLGAHGLVIPKDRAVKVSSTVVKASAGATEHVPIALVTNVARTLEELKQRGLWIVGAVAQDGKPPAELDLTGGIALVLGSEGKGIRPLVLRGCDLFVQIPMVGAVASLNVAAAGAIVLYEALRQRRAATPG